MIVFQYHPEILRQFPNTTATVGLLTGGRNSPTDTTLHHLYTVEQQNVIARIGDMLLSEIETLAAWRSTFRQFGVDPTKYRSAPEALLRRLTKKGDIPSINSLVDLCNLVSIRYAIPVAAFDIRALTLPITVCFSNGEESFTPLGIQDVEQPEPGEVIFVDQTERVAARRWCWRQSQESAASPGTTDAVITIEAQHVSGRQTVTEALRDIRSLFEEFIGGEFEDGLLGGDRLRL